ncbi:MAG TPA: hypothetical protein VN823_28360 [Stellaceae bacterium]|nr:hypothetical protein [Stellaceae bacterium]
MTDRKEHEKPKSKTDKAAPPKKPVDTAKNLPDEALDEVSGGLNPQPLPPGIY